MKILLIVFLVLDLLLVSAAVVRFNAATPLTKPMVAIGLPGGSSADGEAPPSRGSIGTTGTGGAFVEGMRGGRAGDAESTAFMTTTNPHGNADTNASAAIDKAESIEAGREDDLDGAKKKIGKIGK